jgi:hypothetical protein
MELLLILVVGGMAVWLMRPLRDWYVLDVQDAAGTSLDKTVFTDRTAAEWAFDDAVAARAQDDVILEVDLWQVEARSRKEAQGPLKGMALMPMLLKSTKS